MTSSSCRHAWDTIHIGTYFPNGKHVPSAVRVLANHSDLFAQVQAEAALNPSDRS
jgi:hypothetical protein